MPGVIVVARAREPGVRKTGVPVLVVGGSFVIFDRRADVQGIDGVSVPVAGQASVIVLPATGSVGPPSDMHVGPVSVGVKEVVEAEPVGEVVESVGELSRNGNPGGEELYAQDHRRQGAERRACCRALRISHRRTQGAGARTRRPGGTDAPRLDGPGEAR